MPGIFLVYRTQDMPEIQDLPDARSPNSGPAQPPKSAFYDSAYSSGNTNIVPIRRTQNTSHKRIQNGCVNCKRHNLACDVQRPCMSCVVSGKEATCFDVQHKKRGRPKLRDVYCQGEQPQMPPGLNRVSNGLYQVIPVQSIPKTGNPALSGTNSKGEQVPLLTTPEVTPVKTVSPKKFGSPTSPPPTFPQDHPWTYAEKFSPLRTSRGRYSPGKSVTGAEIALGRFKDWGTPLESSSNQVAPPASLMAQYVPLAACFRTDSDSERANLPQSRRLKKKRRRVTEEHPMQNANDEKSDSRKKYRERDFLEVDQKATNELETGSLREHSAPFTQAQETTVACEPPVTSSILSAGQCDTGELSDVAMPEQFSPQTCAYRILGLDTKELTSRIMRDFEHHSDGEEHLTQSDEFSEESSEDSSSQGESRSDDSLMEEEARDSEYLDPHEQAVIQFVYLRNNTTSRGSGSQSRSSDTGSDGIYTPSTSTTTNQCGRDQSKGKKRRSDGGDDPGGKKPREDEKLNVAKTASDTKKLAWNIFTELTDGLLLVRDVVRSLPVKVVWTRT
ncbi:hypothetical protein IWZ01DRAFT_575343 [Phyllosticta capitalensis]